MPSPTLLRHAAISRQAETPRSACRGQTDRTVSGRRPPWTRAGATPIDKPTRGTGPRRDPAARRLFPESVWHALPWIQPPHHRRRWKLRRFGPSAQPFASHVSRVCGASHPTRSTPSPRATGRSARAGRRSSTTHRANRPHCGARFRPGRSHRAECGRSYRKRHAVGCALLRPRRRTKFARPVRRRPGLWIRLSASFRSPLLKMHHPMPTVPDHDALAEEPLQHQSRCELDLVAALTAISAPVFPLLKALRSCGARCGKPTGGALGRTRPPTARRHSVRARRARAKPSCERARGHWRSLPTRWPGDTASGLRWRVQG